MVNDKHQRRYSVTSLALVRSDSSEVNRPEFMQKKEDVTYEYTK